MNRFYFEKRYSDDLDFFTNFSNTFSYSAREIIERISKENHAVEKQVDSKDFIRIRITGEGAFLQVRIPLIPATHSRRNRPGIPRDSGRLIGA